MSEPFECFFESMARNEVFRTLDKRNGQNWSELEKISAQGAVAFDPPRQWQIKGPARTSPPRAATNVFRGYRAVFELRSGRWVVDWNIAFCAIRLDVSFSCLVLVCS